MSALPPLAGDGRRRQIAAVAICALGQAAAAGAAAFATRDIFATLADDSSAVPHVSLVLVAGSGLALALLRMGERVLAERLGHDYAAALRIRLFEHVTRMPAGDVARRRRGYLTLRFVGDLTAVRQWVSLGIARLMSAAIVLPAAALALLLINPDLAAAAAIPLSIGLLAMAAAGWSIGPAHRRLRRRRAQLAADMSERLPHAPELRLLGRIQRENELLKRRTQRMIQAALQRAWGVAVMRGLTDAASAAAATAVMVMAFRTGASAAETAGILAVVGVSTAPLRDMAGVLDRFQAWLAARDRCNALLQAPTLALRVRSDVTRPTVGAPSVQFVGVRKGVLDAINVEAAAGERIAIIGPNGAGKTTLLNLAAGLEQAAAGEVRIAGRSPLSFDAAERHRMIALVSARSPILRGSLRRALSMGCVRRPSDRDVLAWAERFGLATVIERVGGLDGIIAEGGSNLSAGEVRRVLLTRAALSGAGLLLLDEPDDALDAEASRLLQVLVRGSEATILIATHNPLVAATMDTIWFLSGGCIREVGASTAVLAGNGPTAHFLKQDCAS